MGGCESSHGIMITIQNQKLLESIGNLCEKYKSLSYLNYSLTHLKMKLDILKIIKNNIIKIKIMS